MVDDMLKNKSKCCGCSACANICPQKCIQMNPDIEGFLYPHIDEKKCIGCNLCDKVCPVKSPLKLSEKDIRTVIARSKEYANLCRSTSGGMFKVLAENILKQDGMVCAASYDKDFKVKHTIMKIDECNEQTLLKYCGSKYVQSSMEDCYFPIKQYLLLNKKVLFVGTPCQVYGLKKYLQGEYDNLLTVDLVCHGTPSPKLWEKYVAYHENNFKSKIVEATFRSKKYGYHSGGFMELKFDNKKVYRASGRVDFMLKSFFEEICSRPICYECPFKGINRPSDLTLYDCWHFSEMIKNVKDDDLGYTNVIVQSHKGQRYLNLLSDKLEIYYVDTELAKKLDGIMIEKCPEQHPMRSQFYIGIDEADLAKHINKFTPITTKDYFVEWSKKMLYAIGLLQRIRNK